MRGLAEQLEHDELSFRELVAPKEGLLIGKYIARHPREVQIGFDRGDIRFGDLVYQVQKELLSWQQAKRAFHRFPLFHGSRICYGALLSIYIISHHTICVKSYVAAIPTAMCKPHRRSV